jgi:hypothetical protein
MPFIVSRLFSEAVKKQLKDIQAREEKNTFDHALPKRKPT